MLKDSNAMRNHLLNFPHAKIESKTLAIAIRHGIFSDIGCAINMWLKVNDIVETILLAGQGGNFKTHVVLISDWSPEGNAQAFIVTGRSTRTHFYDHDLAILPFSRLSSYSYSLPDELFCAIQEEAGEISHSMVYQLHQNKKNGADLNETMIQDWLLETRICLDIFLDYAEGNTSKFLRRNRYMNWFSADGRSAYEQQFLENLDKNHEMVRRYDPNLRMFDQRRTKLFGIYAMVELNKVKGWDYVGRFESWESCCKIDWASLCPDGIEPQYFDDNPGPFCLGGLYCQVIQTKPPYREFSEDLDWWTYNAEDQFSETEFPCKFFNCSLCIDTGESCRWCKKCEHRKRCGFCREKSREPTGYLSRINLWHREDVLAYWTGLTKPGFSSWQDYQNAFLALTNKKGQVTHERNDLADEFRRTNFLTPSWMTRRETR